MDNSVRPAAVQEPDSSTVKRQLHDETMGGPHYLDVQMASQRAGRERGTRGMPGPGAGYGAGYGVGVGVGVGLPVGAGTGAKTPGQSAAASG